MSKDNVLTTTADAAALAAFAAQFPQESGFSRLMLPRLTFKAQDVFEGKGKNKTVVIEAGTFFTERPTEEKDENGKPVWDKQELGLDIEGFIVYKRKQLRYYEESTETFYSTPIFDDVNSILPLFAGGKKVATGTPAELKKTFEFTNEEGKLRSKLEDNVVLYIVYKDDLYQLSLRGSSMYSFMDFARKVAISPSAHLIHFSSEAQSKGSIEWNQMTFKPVRTITTDEMNMMQEHITAIKDAIDAEREFYAQAAEDATVIAAVVEALPEGKDGF